MKHPSGINDRIVEKVVKRRGWLHAYETIEPSKTALVVIDLDTASVKWPPSGVPESSSLLNQSGEDTA